jgi:hypothetical protein
MLDGQNKTIEMKSTFFMNGNKTVVKLPKPKVIISFI